MCDIVQYLIQDIDRRPPAIITTSVHFAVDELGEIDDEDLVLASSKPEVENALGTDRFYEHLRGCAKD